MGKSGFDFREIDSLAKTLEKYIYSSNFSRTCNKALSTAQEDLYQIEKSAMQREKGKYSTGLTSPQLTKSKVYRIKKGKNKGNYQCLLGFEWEKDVYKFYHALEHGYRFTQDGTKIVFVTPKKHLLDKTLESSKNYLAQEMEDILTRGLKE